jgi:hypothetical protein
MTAADLALDYFLIYDAANKVAAGTVWLRGAFDDQRQRFQLALLDYVAMPAAKDKDAPSNPHGHLAWYGGVQPAEPRRTVSLENAFGRFKIGIGTSFGLLVPTQRIAQGSRFPDALDHFKVYRLTNVQNPPKGRINLHDAFGTSRVDLGVPLYLAVPVAKWHGSKASTSIQSPDANLLIAASAARDVDAKLTLRNQFEKRRSVDIVRTTMVAVPGLTRDWFAG